jgi:tellurite resistance protein TerC
MDFSIIVIIIQLIFLEGILSIDNAAVLGAMVNTLPAKDAIPWPASIRFGHVFDKVLGMQRTAALRVGLLGAYLGRGLMLFAASYIISNPWLKIIGAAYLIRLAVDDLSAHGYSGEDEAVRPIKIRGFWATVLSVELMDLVFSLIMWWLPFLCQTRSGLSCSEWRLASWSCALQPVFSAPLSRRNRY